MKVASDDSTAESADNDSTMFSLLLPRSVYEQIGRMAEDDDRSMSWIVRQLITTHPDFQSFPKED